MSKRNHMWTKDEIRVVLTLWTSSTLDEIAQKLFLEKHHITNLATYIRKTHPELLPKKDNRGYLNALVSQVAQEL